MNAWMLDPDIAYLNHGGFGALPWAVADAATELRAMVERDPTDLLVRRLPGLLNEVRERLAELLNAEPAGCVFVPNATAGVSTVLTSLAPTLDPGDEILTTDHRYHAVSVQLDVVAARYGALPVYAHAPLDCSSAGDVVTAITDRITSRTRLLVVDAIASASGFVFPLAEIVAAAHDRNVPVLVDAAHAPGQIDNDLIGLDADFWVGNLHKWICSPRALAIMAVAPRWRELVRPHVASHRYAEGFQPAFDWTGTFDPVNLLAVPAALDFWNAFGWDDARSRQRSLVDAGAAYVASTLGTNVPVHEEFRAAMRVIALPTVLDSETARNVEAALAREHRVEVVIPELHGASWVRICGQVYNTAADYERLAVALPVVLQTVMSTSHNDHASHR